MSTFAIRQKMIAIARREVGTVEHGGNNKGPKVESYQRATNLEGTGWPWCAAFVDWVVREWLKDAEVREALKIFSPQVAEAWRPKTAAAFGFHEWAEKSGLMIFDDDPSHVLHTGDIMTFDFSHVGIVVTDRESGGISWVDTIEGNTSHDGSRDGDGVWEKTRNRTLARRFIRILN